MKKRVVLLILVFIIGLLLYGLTTPQGEMFLLEQKLKKIADCPVSIRIEKRERNYIYISLRDVYLDNAYHCKEVMDYITAYMNSHEDSLLNGAPIWVSFWCAGTQTYFINYEDQVVYDDFCILDYDENFTFVDNDGVYNNTIREFFECFPDMRNYKVGIVHFFEEDGFGYLSNPQRMEISYIRKSQYDEFEKNFKNAFPECELIVEKKD